MITPKVVAMMPMFFDFLAMRVDTRKAEGLQLRIDWLMQDEQTEWKLTLSHSVLNHARGSHGGAAQVMVGMDRPALAAAICAGGFAPALAQGLIVVGGDAQTLRQLFGTLDVFNPMLNIPEP